MDHGPFFQIYAIVTGLVLVTKSKEPTPTSTTIQRRLTFKLNSKRPQADPFRFRVAGAH